MHKLFLFLFAFTLYISNVSAQKTGIYLDPESGYKTALELFEKKKYGAAMQQFNKVIYSGKQVSSLTKVNAEFYHALCAMELENKNAEFLMKDFIGKYPSDPKSQVARFELGKFHFKNRRYKNASDVLESVSVLNLDNEQAAEYYFKLGYSQFVLNQYEKASKAFYEIKDVHTKYTPQANYYYAHIAYSNKNFETALQSFLKLRDYEEYKSVVPYYISQIYFQQERYQNLIEYAVPVLNHQNPQNSMDISRLVGEAYYRTSEFGSAIPYFEQHQKNSAKITREDIYQLGYSYYKTGDFERAIDKLEKIANDADAISQNSNYILADCFLKTDKKQSARNAFLLASKMNHDREMQEDALFNYARISFELSFQPTAIDAFRQFKKMFPASVRIDQVNEMLSEIYLTTRNYKDALEAMEEIKNKSEKIKRAYQRTAYYRGVELFSDNKLVLSIEHFDKSLKFPADATEEARAHYWKAEAFYKLRNFDNALKSYNDFVYAPGALNLSFYNLANYNIGYCYYKKEDYPKAITAFRKYIKYPAQTDAVRYNDALVRIADGFFIQKDYFSASDFYDDAIRAKAAASDYALFQRGMIYGIQNNLKDKVSSMRQILDSYKSSSYYDDAMYETGSALVLLNNKESAEALFKKLIDEFPRSSYLRKAYLALALMYYNAKEDEPALVYYKKIITDFPSTSEAHVSLLGVKNIYINQGKAEEYIAYAETVPFANVDRNTQDSLTYEAAEIRYMRGDCDNAVNDFNNYLQRFPEGSFTVHAQFYRSECYSRMRNPQMALDGYEFVINSAKNTFTESSLLRAASINYSRKNYDKALKQYSILEEIAEYRANTVEAISGKMRSAYELKKYALALETAQKLLSSDRTSAETVTMAHLISGRSALALDNISLALSQFGEISKFNSEAGAEAKYTIALIHFNQSKYKESQAMIFELVNQVPSYDEWIARAFILLADNYIKLEDSFQAKATLQSIIDNYQGSDASIKNTAWEKLKQILDKEREDHQRELREKLINLPDSLLHEEN